MTDSVKIPLFKKADLDASIGVFFDGFSKVIVAVAILLGTFSLDGGTVFGTMMPGVLVTVLVMNGGLWLYYRHIAKSRGDANLTAVQHASMITPVPGGVGTVTTALLGKHTIQAAYWQNGLTMPER